MKQAHSNGWRRGVGCGEINADTELERGITTSRGERLTTDDEQYERLEHRATFLFDRGLTSQAMHDANKQLRLLVRLVGRNPSRLDPHLRERLHDELEQATLKQLIDTRLFDEWQEAWDTREAVTLVTDEQTGSRMRIEPAIRLRLKA